MKIGSLGDIIFEVSPEVIQTINGLTLSGEANIATHARHLKTGLAEYTGNKPDQITFKIRISEFLGASVSSAIGQLEEYKHSGEQLIFILGTSRIGNAWLLSKYKASIKNYDAKGNPIDADVSITLLEYAKE